MSQSEENEEKKVSEMFDEGMDLYQKIENSEEPTNSSSTQYLVKKAMNILEDATRVVSLTGLFSCNESVEEIASVDLKLLLLPALLGSLSLKLCVEDRMEVIQTAEVYFRDYLRRCKDYGVVDVEIPVSRKESECSSSSTVGQIPSKIQEADLIVMAQQRNEKIKRYKEQKELQSKLDLLRKEVESQNVDDEILREYTLTLIKSFAGQALDELYNLERERPLVEQMNEMRKSAAFGLQEERSRREKPPHKPLKPIIITKDEVQKKVFGAGYPSLPTFTVQEFYDQRVRDGDFPDPSKMQGSSLLDRVLQSDIMEKEEEEEQAEKEMKIETDDPDTLNRAREWDEYKDDHRRGWGNRMNRS